MRISNGEYVRLKDDSFGNARIEHKGKTLTRLYDLVCNNAPTLTPDEVSKINAMFREANSRTQFYLIGGKVNRPGYYIPAHKVKAAVDFFTDKSKQEVAIESVRSARIAAGGMRRHYRLNLNMFGEKMSFDTPADLQEALDHICQIVESEQERLQREIEALLRVNEGLSNQIKTLRGFKITKRISNKPLIRIPAVAA